MKVMQTIKVKKQEVDFSQFVKRPAKETDFKELIREDALVQDENSKLILLYFRFPESTADLLKACKEIPYTTSTRSGGLKTTSTIFGFDPLRSIRKPYCSATALAINYPKQHRVITKFGERIGEIYKEWLPDAFAEHTKIVEEKIEVNWRIPKTPFTSGIVNKNNQLNYHFDSGNFDGVYSNMIVLKNNVAGGYLSLPEYNIGLECADNTLVMFDGQSILHGVTPINFFSSNAYRYSLVYYSLKEMWNCEDLTTELAKVRNRRAKTEKRNATL